MKKFRNYKNYIFDLGGVILNIAPEKTRESFINLEFTDFENNLKAMYAKNIFDDLETNKILPCEFRAEILSHLVRKKTDDEIDVAWNAMLLDFPFERIDLLKKLRPNKNLFLLSNTNSIHCKYFNKILADKHQIADLSLLFDKTYYSFEMGLRKPNPKIFEQVLSDCGLIAQETVFFDDSQENIAAANSLGIVGCLINPENGFVDILNNE